MSSIAIRHGVIAAGLLTGAALTACGGGDEPLHGFVRDPAPNVADVTLPDVSNDGTEFALKAAPGELLVVYFGYTSCPDFCPTTMSDVKLARARQDDPERIDVAMVTVDPNRDLATDPARCNGVILDCYVNSFVEGAHALGPTTPTPSAGQRHRSVPATRWRPTTPARSSSTTPRSCTPWTTPGIW